MDKRSPRRFSSLFITVFAFFALGAFARGAEAAEGHDYHPHHSSIFLGGTSSSGGKHGATIGADYEYRFHPKFGLAALVDYAGGDIDATIVAAGLFSTPWETCGCSSHPAPTFTATRRNSS